MGLEEEFLRGVYEYASRELVRPFATGQQLKISPTEDQDSNRYSTDIFELKAPIVDKDGSVGASDEDRIRLYRKTLVRAVVLVNFKRKTLITGVVIETE